MFTNKKESLVATPERVATKAKSSNGFVQAGMKESAKTTSGNGALKYSSTGNEFVDQFGKVSEYRTQRSYNDIQKDMIALWSLNNLKAVMFAIYLRIITRKVNLFDGTTTERVQRGAGLKHESIMRMIWLHVNHPDAFWKNVNLFISAGSWKDVFTMLSYDLQYNGWEARMLDWDKFGKLILAGLENPNTSELIKKYLPQLKSNSKCKTVEAQANNMIAKWICSLLFGSKEGDGSASYKKYRKLKANGTAHEWQKLISKGKHKLIDFSTVHGRALAQLVSGKYIDNQNLTEAYEAWIMAQPVAKFTGYPHDLFKNLPRKQYQVHTLNKQFAGLVQTAQEGANKVTSFIVVRDTSGSMNSNILGETYSSDLVARSLAVFFNEMLPEGRFADNWIEFSSDAKMRKFVGTTPYEKWTSAGYGGYGGTNFQSVIDLFCNIKSEGVSEAEFPTGILCISDGEFDASEANTTNYETAIAKLRRAGFSDEYVNSFQIVLWNIPNTFYGSRSGTKFETYGDQENIFYFSGYDPSVLAFLTGFESKVTEEGETVQATPKTAEEVFEAAMSQELLQMVGI